MGDVEVDAAALWREHPPRFGIHRLVFHTRNDRRPFDTALGLVDELPWGAVPISDLVDAVHARGFTWGVSDGN